MSNGQFSSLLAYVGAGVNVVYTYLTSLSQRCSILSQNQKSQIILDGFLLTAPASAISCLSLFFYTITQMKLR